MKLLSLSLPSSTLFRTKLSQLSLRRCTTMATNQTIYIVSTIHCPSPDGINPHCYSITGAYSTAAAAQAAMLAKAKELYGAPPTHFHGQPKKGNPEWKEAPFKIEFTGAEGDFGVCWVDERVLGVEEMPITQTLKRGMFGMESKGEGECHEGEMNDVDAEKTLCSLLKF
jgi:hypothetical protein